MKKIFSILLLMVVSISASAQDASFYLKYAEKGDKEAMYNLAQCYINGNGGAAQDYNQATLWLTKAVKKDYAPAQHSLALCYFYGVGVLKDYAQGWVLNQKAVKQGYPPALYTTACCYRDGYYVSQDNQQWISWLNKAAGIGDDDAQADLARIYLFGLDAMNITHDPEKAYYYSSKAAEQNNADGFSYLGVCYKFGFGVEVDENKALSNFYQGAQGGNAIAQCEVGEAYLRGTGVEVNYSEAAKYIKAAVDQENARGYKLMGDLYYYGLGVEENDETAAEWYKKGMEAGNNEALTQLAYMYLYGIGVSVNETKGFQLYKQAAEQNLTLGYAGLGQCYESGLGTQKNIQLAIDNYKKAAEDHNYYSMHRLYFIFRDGEGTADHQTAIQYLRQASDEGYGAAQYSLGYEYLVGEILHKEESSALDYMTKAADGGYIFACAVLGTFYYDGEPLVSKDYNKAFAYLSKAAADTEDIGRDDLIASVYKRLGACYRFGRGTEVDQSLASYYTEQAAKYGDQSSVDAVKMLRR